MFLVDTSNTKKWFKVIPPKGGQRVEVYSCSPVYVLVRTVLSDVGFSHKNIQQSDYSHIWSKSVEKVYDALECPPSKIIKWKIRNSALLYRLLLPTYRIYLTNYKLKLSGQNPGLVS